MWVITGANADGVLLAAKGPRQEAKTLRIQVPAGNAENGEHGNKNTKRSA